MTMVCIRFVIATVILNVFLRRFDPGARLRKKDLLPLAVSGLFGVTLCAAMRPIGSAMITARMVPSEAMCSVSTRASCTPCG